MEAYKKRCYTLTHTVNKYFSTTVGPSVNIIKWQHIMLTLSCAVKWRVIQLEDCVTTVMESV